jgi:hypothetical protein
MNLDSSQDQIRIHVQGNSFVYPNMPKLTRFVILRGLDDGTSIQRDVGGLHRPSRNGILPPALERFPSVTMIGVIAFWRWPPAIFKQSFNNPRAVQREIQRRHLVTPIETNDEHVLPTLNIEPAVPTDLLSAAVHL